MIQWLVVVSKYGKVRLKRWFKAATQAEKTKACAEITALVLSRKPSMSNLVDYRGSRLVYKRYASLCFCIDDDDNELIALEIIHRYVQVLDRYFGNVSELDIVFGIIESYALLDELLISGEMVEPSLNSVLKVISKVEEAERDSILMENLVRHSLA